MEAVFRTAAQALEEESGRLRLTTGNGDLDAFLGGVELGRFYLFYGNDQGAMDMLIHNILINSVLPVEAGGFGAKALYFNNCNYHQGKTILNPSLLGEFAKRAGLDPAMAFENIYCVCAFNERQQPSAAKEVVGLLSRSQEIRLLVVHNLTRFLETSRRPGEAHGMLMESIGAMLQTASRNGITVVANCAASGKGIGCTLRPPGGTFLRHEANVIVYLRRVERIGAIKACLVKHPYREAPDSIVLRVSEGGMNLMGRITPSFRQLFESQVEELKRSFQNALLDLNHREAFGLLLREAWSAEGHAMSSSKAPVTLDAMNLMANVHNKKCVEELRKALNEREERIRELEGRLERLERRIEGEGH